VARRHAPSPSTMTHRRCRVGGGGGGGGGGSQRTTPKRSKAEKLLGARRPALSNESLSTKYRGGRESKVQGRGTQHGAGAINFYSGLSRLSGRGTGDEKEKEGVLMQIWSFLKGNKKGAGGRAGNHWKQGKRPCHLVTVWEGLVCGRKGKRERRALGRRTSPSRVGGGRRRRKSGKMEEEEGSREVSSFFGGIMHRNLRDKKKKTQAGA